MTKLQSQYERVVKQNRQLQAELREKTAEYQKLISENDKLQEANELLYHIRKSGVIKKEQE